MGDTEFYDAVGERGGLDPAAADDAVLATLSALGDHLSDTVVDDLCGPLPGEATDAFRAGAADAPSGFAYEEFAERVADALGVDEGEAERRARAVGATLAERAPDDALADARDQLPEAYDRLFWVPTADEVLTRVRESAGLRSDDAAREATAAVLAALGERVTPGEAEAVAAYLPDEFAAALEPDADVPDAATGGQGDERETETGTDAVAADYDVDEFVARVSELAAVDEERAREFAGAVSDALAGVVPPHEFEDLLEQLPDEYGTVL